MEIFSVLFGGLIGGVLLGVMFAFRDRKRNRQAHQQIQESEEKYRKAFHTSPDAVNINRMDGMYVDVNEGFTHLTGFTRDDVIGKLSTELDIWAVPADREKLVDGLKQSGFVRNLESKFRCKGGSVVTGLMSAVVISINNEPHILSITRDFTERRISEDLLIRNQEIFTAFMDANSDCLFIKDDQCRYVFSDQQTADFFNKKQIELIGKTDEELAGPDLTESWASSDRQILETGEEITIEVQWGSLLYEVTKFPVVLPEGKKGIGGIMKNITNKRKYEEEIKLLQSAVDQSSVFVIITNSGGNIKYVNPAFEKATGYTLAEVKGQNPRILQSGEHSVEFYKELWATISTGKTWKGKFHNKKKNGQLYWGESTLSPVMDESGAITHFIGIQQDITKRTNLENVKTVLYKLSNAVLTTKDLKEYIAMIRSELGAVIDTTNFFVALYNELSDTFSLPYFTDSYDEITEFPASKTITRYVVETQKPLLAKLDDLKKLEQEGKIALIGKGSKQWLGFPLKVGERVIGAMVIQSYTDENAFSQSDVEMLEVISANISLAIHRIQSEEELQLLNEQLEVQNEELKQTLEQLEQNNEELFEAKEKAEKGERELIASQKVARVGYYIFDIPNNTWTNSEMLDELFGIDKNYNKTIEGWTSIIHEEDRQMMADYLLEEVIQDKKPFDKQYRIVNQKDQKIYWVHGLGRLDFDEQGNLKTMFGTIQDITTLKYYELSIIEAKEKAEESDRLKSAFLANMSHEIRTPMNGILGFLSLLEEPEMTKLRQKEFIEIINKSGKRLMTTINDLIDISKIESGQLQIVKTITNIDKLLIELHAFYKPQAEEKGLSLSIMSSENSDSTTVLTDNNKLHGILSNLIRNAIKYTNKGSIGFGYTLTDDFFEFYVKDTGIGVIKERQEAIFNRFEQADIGDTRAYEGSGLGLAISKAYVEKLGGKIWLISEVGKGSEFRFTIPYEIKILHSNIAN